MPEPAVEGLRERALEVLARNRRGAWTCPSSAVYPHQWLWDSCFVAIGLARDDPQRAAVELCSVFRGQWANGMLPHMIFGDGLRDLGSRRLWRSKRQPDAPRDVSTSCITQPPIAAIAAGRITDALPAAERHGFLDSVVPRLAAYHAWLYRERDPWQHGLVTLIHPWECGLDTTPSWMGVLAASWHPWWLRVVHRFHLARVVRLLRTDTRYVPVAQRASDDDGLRMLALARTDGRFGFDPRRLPADRAVMVEDLAFNALLVVANRVLERLADDAGKSLDPALRDAMRATEAALEELWDEPSAQYYSRNVISGELIKVPTVATFLPLWAGVAAERAARLVQVLRDEARWWPEWPVPSVPADDANFDPERYWQGPTWVNTNWLIVEGLRRNGAADLAVALARRTVELVARGGFFEYFSPLTGQGFGAADFSWTAALTLDLLELLQSRGDSSISRSTT